jgi:hypothetical protein
VHGAARRKHSYRLARCSRGLPVLAPTQLRPRIPSTSMASRWVMLCRRSPISLACRSSTTPRCCPRQPPILWKARMTLRPPSTACCEAPSSLRNPSTQEPSLSNPRSNQEARNSSNAPLVPRGSRNAASPRRARHNHRRRAPLAVKGVRRRAVSWNKSWSPLRNAPRTFRRYPLPSRHSRKRTCVTRALPT